MKRLKHFEVVNVTDKKAESLGRGNGALLFRRKREDGPIEVYYRYFRGNSPVTISLGEYKKSKAYPTGLTLDECRKKAGELANLRRDIKPHDLKEHLYLQIEKQKREKEQAKRQAEVEASRGTLADLLIGYVDSLKASGKASATEVERALQREVITAHKELVDYRARDVAAEDIRQILVPVYRRGSRVMGNRLRSHLLAAFSFGLETDLDPEREGEKVFCLEYNPVSAIKPKRDAESVGERSLNQEEVFKLWTDIGLTPKVGPLMALFIQFLFALGGQRPKQVLACKWSDYDLRAGTLTIMNTKGRNQRPVKHVVPLTGRARDILKQVHLYTEQYDWPFTSKGLAPYSIDSINTAVSRYVAVSGTEHFSPRDIRRTVKNLMIDAGVNREQRNLLQGHNQTGVDIKHYERHDQLQDKRAGIAKYDKLLSEILNPEAFNVLDTDNGVTVLSEYRQVK